MVDIKLLSHGALRYVAGLGSPFLFLEERTVELRANESIEVKNQLPKVVFVLEGSMRCRFGTEESGVLQPGAVLINFENRSHSYLPFQPHRGGRMRVLRLTLPWDFQLRDQSGKSRKEGDDFGYFTGMRLPTRGLLQMPVAGEWGALLRDLRHTLVSRAADRRFRATALGRLALLELMHSHRALPPSRRSREKDLQDRIEKFLEDNLHRKISLADVADSVDRTEEHVARFFRQRRKRTVFEELKRMRIERSRYLLLCTELSITKVAEQSGFATLAHFSRTFRDITGKSPQQFRASRLEER